MDATIAEDNAILERQQAGLASPLARPSRLSHLEVMLGAFGRWIAERVLEDNGTGAAAPRHEVKTLKKLNILLKYKDNITIICLMDC
jgi:hypothetical protein